MATTIDSALVLGQHVSNDGFAHAVPYGTAPADYQTDVLANRAVAAIRERVLSPQPFYLK